MWETWSMWRLSKKKMHRIQKVWLKMCKNSYNIYLYIFLRLFLPMWRVKQKKINRIMKVRLNMKNRYNSNLDFFYRIQGRRKLKDLLSKQFLPSWRTRSNKLNRIGQVWLTTNENSYKFICWNFLETWDGEKINKNQSGSCCWCLKRYSKIIANNLLIITKILIYRIVHHWGGILRRKLYVI